MKKLISLGLIAGSFALGANADDDTLSFRIYDSKGRETKTVVAGQQYTLDLTFNPASTNSVFGVKSGIDSDGQRIVPDRSYTTNSPAGFYSGDVFLGAGNLSTQIIDDDRVQRSVSNRGTGITNNLEGVVARFNWVPETNGELVTNLNFNLVEPKLYGKDAKILPVNYAAKSVKVIPSSFVPSLELMRHHGNVYHLNLNGEPGANGVIYSSDSVTGPWNQISSGVIPYMQPVTNATGKAKFYQARAE